MRAKILFGAALGFAGAAQAAVQVPDCWTGKKTPGVYGILFSTKNMKAVDVLKTLDMMAMLPGVSVGYPKAVPAKETLGSTLHADAKLLPGAPFPGAPKPELKDVVEAGLEQLAKADGLEKIECREIPPMIAPPADEKKKD